MTKDKQLWGISVHAVRIKRDADQALNIKEFAVLAGVSYSVAREWFHLSGFPALFGKVFWQDFVEWRKVQNRAREPLKSSPPQSASTNSSDIKHSTTKLPARAAQILLESAK